MPGVYGLLTAFFELKSRLKDSYCLYPSIAASIFVLLIQNSSTVISYL